MVFQTAGGGFLVKPLSVDTVFEAESEQSSSAEGVPLRSKIPKYLHCSQLRGSMVSSKQKNLLDIVSHLGNGTGFRNPYGSRVRVLVGTGVGRVYPTHELENEPLFIQNS